MVRSISVFDGPTVSTNPVPRKQEVVDANSFNLSFSLEFQINWILSHTTNDAVNQSSGGLIIGYAKAFSKFNLANDIILSFNLLEFFPL